MFKSCRIKFASVMAWLTLTGVVLVGLSVAATALLEKQIVDQAGAHNRQVQFLRISGFVSNMIAKRSGIRDVAVLQELLTDVRGLTAGILRLSVFEIKSGESSLIVSTDP